MPKLVPIRRYSCQSCDEMIFFDAARSTNRHKGRCPACGDLAQALGQRGPGPGQGGRKTTDDPRSIALGVRVTRAVAEQIDLYRGSLTRSVWLRAAINETLLALTELEEDASLQYEDAQA